MARDIVVFERDFRYGEPKLDFRLIRSILPAGSIPLAIVDQGEFRALCGLNFDREEVAAYAEKQSGYPYRLEQ